MDEKLLTCMVQESYIGRGEMVREWRSPWDSSLLRLAWLCPEVRTSWKNGWGKEISSVWFRSLGIDGAGRRGSGRTDVLI